ncbi:hypothetical protein F5Y03DRAFT_408906 [Xylaria venustula]|nr:hypothetical protein F5Y03DRAFT_408906 [Xylaria venustula]
MCFTEYIAYQCGHTSTAVSRPCPMTTHQHSNPCCPKPASRPFLYHKMCYPCARIIHARKIDIAEYEHRWMHERGACDCEVQFPGLTEPRLIKRSSTAGEEKETSPTSNASNGADSSAVNYYTSNARTTSSNFTGHSKGSSIPMYAEAKVGDNVEVAVRMTSLYGAEWTKDHAKLHDSGKCKCPVSFERYKPLDVDHDQDETDRPGFDYSDSPEQIRKMSHNNQAPVNPVVSYKSDARTWVTNKFSADDPFHPYGRDWTHTGQIARWASEGPQGPGSLLDQILGPVGSDASVHGGHPMDIQTMHYPKNGVPIAGNPIVCETSQESALPSIVEYPQPKETLAGFPIGAGPEGESHAGDFETCSLNSSSELSPVSMRRLSSEF